MQVRYARSHPPWLWPRRAVPTTQAWRAFEQVEKSGCRAEFLGMSRPLATAGVAINAVSVTTSLEMLRMASLPVELRPQNTGTYRQTQKRPRGFSKGTSGSE